MESQEIKSESMESAKALVGKTLLVKGGRRALIKSWTGRDYQIEVDGKTASYPVMVILQQIQKGLMKIGA